MKFLASGDELAPRRVPRMKRGELDLIAGYVGRRKSGKTDLLCNHVLDFTARQPAHVFAIDPNGNLPRTLHNGRPTGVVRHEELGSVVEYLRTKPLGGIHALRTDDATPALRYAWKLAEHNLSPEDAKGNRYGVPCVVIVDEMTIWEEAKEGGLGETLKKQLTQCRHKHTALFYGTQSPRRCHYSLFDLATEVHLFRMKGKKDLSRLEEGGIDDPAFIARVKNLPRFQTLVYRPGED